MNKEILTKNIITTLAKHPYISLFCICIFISPFFFGAIENIPPNALWLESIMVFAALCFFAIYRYRKKQMNKLQFGIFAISSLTAVIAAAQLYSYSAYKALWHFFGGCIIIFILYHFADSKHSPAQQKSFLIIGMGMCLKLYYVLITSVYDRQHDVKSFGDDSGHAGYMEYLLFEHHLPDFDVRDRWQFCHPPLHHIISAVWIFINENIMQAGHDPARESLQMLTLFYSGCIVITAYKIFRHFGFEGNSLYIPLMLVSFHPAFTLFSGSINNDPLSTAFVAGAVLYTLKWYRTPTMKNILKIALCVGLSMMTKISAATVAPPIALVFLIVFIRKFKTDRKELLKQFISFGFICVPLGLWYGIRNYIKWKVPLIYVSELSENETQYIKNMTFFQRITDFSLSQFKSPYILWETVDENGISSGFDEFNPLTALMKNSVFGESINQDTFTTIPYVNIISHIFFWLNAAIAGFALIAMAVSCIRKLTVEKVFLVSFYVTMMAVFYRNCADYPFVCTMNFRYITPTVIIGAVFIGLTMRSEHKRLNSILSASAAAFSAASMIVYLSLT